jgi:pectate lyase
MKPAPGFFRSLLITFGLFGALGLRADEQSSRDAARLAAVTDFADHVLTDAADRYHPGAPSPLLANGINVYTKEHLKWVFPESADFPGGRVLVWSDFAVQQNLMRVLAGLTNVTGNPKYRDAAKAEYAYYFAHLQDKSGLLQWGGHRFVDLLTRRGVGMRDGPPDSPHELKNAFPYYDLMYEVNPAATVKFITGFWNAHVYHWNTLEISRHGAFGHEPGANWDHPFDDPPPFFDTLGLSFMDAGNDLIYSGAALYRLTGDKGALLWAKRLAAQYVKARDPVTHLGAYQYTQPRRQHAPPTDESRNDFTFSEYGDRANRMYGPDFPGHRVLEGTMLLHQHAATIYSNNALMQMEVAQSLGDAGKDLLESTRAGMDAFVNYALIPEQNLLRPMLTDGTDLSGFVNRRRGYYGPEGRVNEPYPVTGDFMLSYARAFLLTGDPTLWKMARSSAKGLGLGEIGETPGKGMELNLATQNADAFALFSVLDLYEKTRVGDYLQLARAIGDNIVKHYYHHGYFTPYEDTIFANVNAIEPYALLALDAASKGAPDKVPYFINGFGFYAGFYRFGPGQSREVSEQFLFAPRKSQPQAESRRGGRNRASARPAIKPDITVAQDGSGQYASIQAAFDSIPRENQERAIIFIKNGVYREHLRLDRSFVTIKGEDRFKTRLVWEINDPRKDPKANADGKGIASFNLKDASDVVIENLTIENPANLGLKPFAVGSTGTGTRIIIQDAEILGLGGDTLSLWTNGLYYHRNLHVTGTYHFVGPRGTCYLGDSLLECLGPVTNALFNEGMEAESQKFVLQRCRIISKVPFGLGSHFRDAAWYFVDCEFPATLRAEGKIFIAQSNANRPKPVGAMFKWPTDRVYFANARGPDYPWLKDNIQNSPAKTAAAISAAWTFSGQWDPESSKSPAVVQSVRNGDGFNVTFSEPVTVKGRPALALGDKRLAVYQAGSGSAVLTFKALQPGTPNFLQMGGGAIVASRASAHLRSVPDLVKLDG